MKSIPRQSAKANIVSRYSGEMVREGAQHVEEILGWMRC